MGEPQCDLILLSWNHLEETQPCLESLFRHTDVPSRLFIVDNGSEPHVRQFLKTVRPRGAIWDVVLLQNQTNEGFPKGMNRGMRLSSAPYVCLLNNDLLFAPGWLSRLIEVGDANPQIGILNPASSRSLQGDALEAWGRAVEARRGDFVELGSCIGFCMLIKRQVMERIGYLSEEVERIFFEDEDYSMRVQAAGFLCVSVESACVFHAEHQSVKHVRERELIFQRNRAWCEGRWGRWLRVAYPRFSEAIPGTAYLRTWLEQLVSWARKRAFIYVYCPVPTKMTPEALFRSVGLVPHANVFWRVIPIQLVRWAAAMAILKRQKKRFDAIIAPDERWARAMCRLRMIHRAQVIPATDLDGLSRLWKTR